MTVKLDRAGMVKNKINKILVNDQYGIYLQY